MGVLFNLAIIDIDYFKQYNDTYGHQDGDACLVRIAHILESYFRRSNETVTRYSGEEFVVMNFGDAFKEFVERIEQLSFIVENSKIEHTGSKIGHFITISVGVASTDNAECNSVRELMGAADNALYLAKGEGRNRVVVFCENHLKHVAG